MWNHERIEYPRCRDAINDVVIRIVIREYRRRRYVRSLFLLFSSFSHFFFFSNRKYYSNMRMSLTKSFRWHCSCYFLKARSSGFSRVPVIIRQTLGQARACTREKTMKTVETSTRISIDIEVLCASRQE